MRRIVAIGAARAIAGTTLSVILLQTPAWAACNDGIVDGGEQCDDGDLENGDGCSTTCTIETCWSCAGAPSVCTPAPSTISTIDSGDDVGRYTSIEIGSDGFAVISYYDATNGNLKVAHCNDPQCTSATVSTVDPAGTVGQFSSLAIGADGFPIISYYDSGPCVPPLLGGCSGHKLAVAHCNDLACSTPATISTRQVRSVAASPTAIIIGSDGLPFVAYRQQATSFGTTAGSLGVFHCSDVACTAVDDSHLIDNVGPAITHGLSGYDAAAALGTDGFPLLVFEHTSTSLHPEYGQRLAHCTNTTCTAPAIRTIEGPEIGTANSLTIGADGFGLNSRINDTAWLRVTHCSDIACSASVTNTVENGGAAADFTSIDSGPDGLGIISYYDGVSDDLRIAHCNDTACSSVTVSTVDSAGEVGLYNSVVVGSNGAPLISYYDHLNGDLKVAHVCPVTAGCGNSTIEAGELCDDGNALDGDGCSPSCQPGSTFTPTVTPTLTPTSSPTLTRTITSTRTSTPTRTPTRTATDTPTSTPTGTPTDTVTPTATDTPTITATPTETPLCFPTPRTGCREATGSSVSLRKTDDGMRDSLMWKWKGGAEAQSTDFGDPIYGLTDYALCVYDTAGGTPSLAVSAIAPAGGNCSGGYACWRETRRGPRYIDDDRITRGKREITLSATPGRRSSIRVRVKGDRLQLPPAASPTQFFDQDTSLVVQLVTSDGPVCWQAIYAAPAARNTAERFADRKP